MKVGVFILLALMLMATGCAGLGGFGGNQGGYGYPGGCGYPGAYGYPPRNYYPHPQYRQTLPEYQRKQLDYIYKNRDQIKNLPPEQQRQVMRHTERLLNKQERGNARYYRQQRRRHRYHR